MSFSARYKMGFVRLVYYAKVLYITINGVVIFTVSPHFIDRKM